MSEPTSATDVVYVCRQGPENEELRYSLRSLANVPHGKVVIAGGWPDWVRDVTTVPVARSGDKYEQTTWNLLAALEHVGERFYLMNDDFFVMRHIPIVPMHRGRLATLKHGNGDYVRRMHEMAAWLEAEGLPALCYEVHAPMPMERDAVAEALALPAPKAAKDRHKRSLYGNAMRVGGRETPDFKTNEPHDWPFLSTNDTTFARYPIGAYIRRAFPDPSPYEVSDGDH